MTQYKDLDSKVRYPYTYNTVYTFKANLRTFQEENSENNVTRLRYDCSVNSLENVSCEELEGAMMAFWLQIDVDEDEVNALDDGSGIELKSIKGRTGTMPNFNSLKGTLKKDDGKYHLTVTDSANTNFKLKSVLQ